MQADILYERDEQTKHISLWLRPDTTEADKDGDKYTLVGDGRQPKDVGKGSLP